MVRKHLCISFLNDSLAFCFGSVFISRSHFLFSSHTILTRWNGNVRYMEPSFDKDVRKVQTFTPKIPDFILILTITYYLSKWLRNIVCMDAPSCPTQWKNAWMSWTWPPPPPSVHYSLAGSKESCKESCMPNHINTYPLLTHISTTKNQDFFVRRKKARKARKKSS